MKSNVVKRNTILKKLPGEYRSIILITVALLILVSINGALAQNCDVKNYDKRLEELTSKINKESKVPKPILPAVLFMRKDVRAKVRSGILQRQLS
jgi:hypothetical protein